MNDSRAHTIKQIPELGEGPPSLDPIEASTALHARGRRRAMAAAVGLSLGAVASGASAQAMLPPDVGGPTPTSTSDSGSSSPTTVGDDAPTPTPTKPKPRPTGVALGAAAGADVGFSQPKPKAKPVAAPKPKPVAAPKPKPKPAATPTPKPISPTAWKPKVQSPDAPPAATPPADSGHTVTRSTSTADTSTAETSTTDATPASAPPPVARPQTYGVDAQLYAHLGSDDRDAIRTSYEAKHPPATSAPDAVTDPQPTTVPTSTTTTSSAPGAVDVGKARDDIGPASTTAAPDAVTDPQPTTTVSTKKPKVDDAPPPKRFPRSKSFGVDSQLYAHLPDDDRVAVKQGYERKVLAGRADTAGCTTSTGNYTDEADRPCVFPNGTQLPLGAVDPDGKYPKQGPVLANHEAPTGLPFPGSVTASCSQSFSSGTNSCTAPGAKPAEPGSPVDVSVDVSETQSEGDPVMDEYGDRRTTLSVSGDVRVTASGKGKTKKGIDLGVSGYKGTSTNYSVTVDSDRADDISDGKSEPPNPIDPRTLEPGDGIEIDKDDYDGSGLSAQYKLLQAQLSSEKGKRISSGVQMVDSDTARVYVGDEDFVRNALKLGVGNDDIGAAISLSNDFSDGKLRSLDLDLSTPDGWDAYQRFVAKGKLASGSQKGVKDEVNTDKASWSGSASLDAHLGPASVSVGGTTYNGEITESHHADGTVDHDFSDHDGQTTWTQSSTTSQTGVDGPQKHSLLLEDVHESYIPTLRDLDGGPGGQDEPDKGQDLKLDFTDADLMQMQDDVIDQLSAESKDARDYMTPDEIRDKMRGDPGAVTPSVGGGDPTDRAIAAAEYPRDVMLALYNKARGHSTTLIDYLVRTRMMSGRYTHENPLKGNMPGSVTDLGDSR